MRSKMHLQRRLMLGLLLFWSFSHIQVSQAQDDPPAKQEAPAEKIRKALDQGMVLDFTGNSIQEVLNHLKEKTRVNFVLDFQALNFPIDDPMGGVGTQYHLKSEKAGKVRTTLQRMLTPFNLTYVIVGDSVLITSEELGLHRQMRQRVSVDVNEQPLKDCLKDLARTTGLNLVIDPRINKLAQGAVSLQLDDATVETAVKLLAEMGNLKAVRMGNVLFVTNEERAEKIRREERESHAPQVGPDGMVIPFGLGGGNVGFPGAGVFRNVVPGVAAPAGAPAVPDQPVPDMEQK